MLDNRYSYLTSAPSIHLHVCRCQSGEAPGFGKVIVTADNEGTGYRLGEQPVIDFRTEAAKSKVVKTRDRLDALTAAGYAFEAQLVNKVEQAERALQAALAGQGEAAAR